MIEYDLDALCVLTDAAARFFVAEVDGSWVPDYLVSRGLGPEIWRPWAIGYAPAGWTALTTHLRGLGFSAQVIEAAGLAKRSARGSLIDVFRDRAMFPVRAADGSVTGFIGRAPPEARERPVYLNSPTTALYHKGSLLFGLHEALSALAEGARPVIAEGPLDAIAITAAGQLRLGQAGSSTSGSRPASASDARPRYVGVAPCGTALTRAQVTLLQVSMAPSAPQTPHPLAPSAPQIGTRWHHRHVGEAAADGEAGVGGVAPSARQTPHPLASSAPQIGTRWHHRHMGEAAAGGEAGGGAVVIAFDGDEAGRRAAVRAFDLFRDADGGGEMSAALFPACADSADADPATADPAGYFRAHGATALGELLDAAVPLADLVVDARLAEFDRWLEFTDGRFAALRAVAPLVADLPVGQVARQVARVADRLDLSYAEVTEAVTTALSRRFARSSLAAISSSRSTPVIWARPNR